MTRVAAAESVGISQPSVDILLVAGSTLAESLSGAFFSAGAEWARLTAVNTLSAAWSSLEQVTPGLIIAELRLSDGSAIEFLRGDAVANPWPIIVLTDRDDESEGANALKAGALDHVIMSEAAIKAMPDIAKRALRAWEHIHGRRKAQDLADHLGHILDDSLNEIYRYDANTLQFLQVNRAAQENLGYSAAELYSLTPADLLPEYTSTALEELLSPLRSGRQDKVQLTTIHLRKDGSRYPVDIHIQLTSFASVPEFLAVVLDLTEKAKAERQTRQLDRLAAVGQLASGVAHDLNNIMAVITLYTQISMQSSELPEKVQQRLGIVADQAQQASRLVQQILDFSRVGMPERHPLDLSLTLKELVKLLERTLPSNIEVAMVVGRGEHMVSADLTRMQQIFMNLAVNARDAMPRGGELRFELNRLSLQSTEVLPVSEMRPGDWIAVRVRDTGTGIPADVQMHIFEPFYTTKRPDEGTGLGLTQVSRIVKEHDGYVEVSSEPGKGSTFTIWLPALPITVSEPVVTDTTNLVRGQGETILLVEDSVQTRNAIIESLELLGYEVLAAEHGHAALSLMEEHGNGISLIISDLVMPKMGGEEFLRLLRRQGSKVPMIIITGYMIDGGALKLREFGVVDWLPKPPRLESLAESVSLALQDIRRH